MVRLESSRNVTIQSEELTAHTATVLRVLKEPIGSPSLKETATLLELPCQFCNDHGLHRNWDETQPLPTRGDWLVYLHWDRAYNGYRIIEADSSVAPALSPAGFRCGDPRVRPRVSSRP
jgi:hypothetical protein